MPVLPPMRPFSAATIGAVVNVLVPLHVFVFARSVEEAAKMVMGAVPSKFTPLIARVVARAVAVPARPVMLIDIAVDVETDAKVFAPVAYKRPDAAEI